MKHFPIFLAVEGRHIVVSGGGEAALAKLRLLMKTEGNLTVFAEDVAPEVEMLGAEGKLAIVRRALQAGDAKGAALFYAANDDDIEDARVTALAQADHALTNWVDNLEHSQFITPAIVDRDPVTVAIGTDGAAPVLARAIKAEREARLPTSLGLVARVGKAFREPVGMAPLGMHALELFRGTRSSFRGYLAGPRDFAVRSSTATLPALVSFVRRDDLQHEVV